MSEHHNRLSSLESVLLKSLSLVGILVFTGAMVGRWNHVLAEAALAESEVAQTVDTTPEVAPVTEPEEVIVASASTTLTPVKPATPVLITETLEIEVAPEVETAEEVDSMAIVDEEMVDGLRSDLYEQINSNWQTLPTFSESLVYQVDITKEGAIADYTALNSAASDYLSETPLENLQQTDHSSTSAPFLVVMTPTGVLEVSPWTGN